VRVHIVFLQGEKKGDIARGVVVYKGEGAFTDLDSDGLGGSPTRCGLRMGGHSPVLDSPGVSPFDAGR